MVGGYNTYAKTHDFILVLELFRVGYYLILDVSTVLIWSLLNNTHTKYCLIVDRSAVQVLSLSAKPIVE